MATHHGKNGVVKVGSNSVGEVTDFSIDINTEVADDTQMGDAWNTHLIGQNSWSAQITANWDPADTNGQVALAEGASVTLHLWSYGAATGAKGKTGTATVTKIAGSVPMRNKTSITFSVTGNGALSDETAS